ncbi:hypothetical protein AJ78_07100 [Emergomyces pasteurianus Ep9510]|uniref:DUF7770 domain-containing protein n=1 Tax=Emergomyces pasteurianus Ep9510 TaxID=1447872 RepID=A0A1J9Q7V0_9EURO|nr:hypothetical protein AJ78_07100 [Emergomyces pasteurianus Ep9510]
MSFNDQIVVKVRFVAHTMGVVGCEKSRNHWSIYLILEGEKSSVRLNMFLADGGHEYGTFSVTQHAYAVSDSMLAYFDYRVCADLKVGHCLQLIQEKGRAGYRMTGSGNGCRHWVRTVFLDLAEKKYTLLSDDESNQFMQRIQNRYHRNKQGQVEQIPDEMEIGEFVDFTGAI